MKKLVVLLIALSLCLVAAACGSKAEDDPIPQTTVGTIAGSAGAGQNTSSADGTGAASSAAPSAPELAADAVTVDASEYNQYLIKYVAPYGCLTTFTDSWTDSAQLGADRMVWGALQIGFRYFRSSYDYSELYGDDFLRLQVPEAWADMEYGCVYPAEQIENITVEYFGQDAAFMQTSQYYIPARKGYVVPDDAPVEGELLPVVTGVRRSGNRAEITFDLKQPDASGKPAGAAVSTKVMTIEDKTETFRYVAVVDAP